MGVIKDAQKLLDILGVDLNEEWKYETAYVGQAQFRIRIEANVVRWETYVHCSGDYINDRYEWTDATDVFSTSTLIDILAHPERIVRLSEHHWAKQDADDALAVKRVFPGAYSVERVTPIEDNGGRLILRSDNVCCIACVENELFPSVKVGDGPVPLDGIIEEYQEQEDQEETITRIYHDSHGGKIIEYTVTSTKGSTKVKMPTNNSEFCE